MGIFWKFPNTLKMYCMFPTDLFDETSAYEWKGRWVEAT